MSLQILEFCAIVYFKILGATSISSLFFKLQSKEDACKHNKVERSSQLQAPVISNLILIYNDA